MKTLKKQYPVRNDAGSILQLQDILSDLPNADKKKWAIVWLYATPINDAVNILQLEAEINNAIFVKILTTDELILFTKQFFQFLEFFIIGDSDIKKLHKYENDGDYYTLCEYVIELFDSSYWLVNTPPNQLT